MSFFKNITKEFESFNLGDKKPGAAPPAESSHQGQRDYGSQRQGQEGPPTPHYQPPSDKPPLPQGWLAQFEQQHQRWFYVEQATGRSQWEAPGYGGRRDDRGYGAPGYGGGDGHGDQGYGHGSNPYYGEQTKDKKSSHSGMLLGAAGGLAAGAVGGALIADALSDSDDDHHSAPPPSSYYSQPPPQQDYGYSPSSAAPSYAQDPYAQDPDGAPPAVLPPTDADGDSVSGSDREDVQDARDDYEEALADANDSNASSSDQEEVEEAQEEYEETYEEVYDD